MHKTLLLLLILTGSAFAIGSQPPKPTISKIPARNQLNHLLKQYEANRQDRQFVHQFLELATSYPKSSAALDSLNWVLKRFESGTHADTALGILTNHHAIAANIDDVFIYIGNNPSLKVGEFYRKVISENKSATVLGKAHYRLGIYLVRQMEIAREVIAKQGAREKYDLFYGQDLTSYLLAMDHRQCRTEALSQFTIIKQKYTSIKTYRGQLGKLAALEEFKLAHLSVGGIVPEIVGKDIQGKPMRLSDYRGKVVLLDFWGDWCVACRTLYSFNRQLHEKMQHRPFALIGVNSDANRELTRRVLSTQQIHWRSFWNDGSRFGKISTQWDIKTWPVLYVIDGKGVIHLRSEGGHNKEEIFQLVEKLTQEIENQ